MTGSLYIHRKTPFPLFEINILDANERQLSEISRETSIGLNLQEMKVVQEYFRKRKRNPTDIELQTIGQTWSEHCFHKTFNGKIQFDGKGYKGD
jgi:phosphoribosylformylglycinamidine (FGAM) synthase-like enzyme